MERKTMNINEIALFTGMSRRTIYYKMTTGTLPFRWFTENGHRVSYFDDVSVWFYNEAEKDFAVIRPFFSPLRSGIAYYDKEHERRVAGIYAAHVEKGEKERLEQEERRRLREEEIKQKKREYMRLKRLDIKRQSVIH
jgi:hypothetical protein